MFKVSLLQRIHDFFWAGPYPQNGLATSLYISSRAHQMIRYAFAIYTTILYISECIEDRWAMVTNLQYLTMWGVYMNLFYFWFAARNLHWKVSHLIFEIAFSVQIAIVSVYWLAVFPTVNKKDTFFWWWQTISEHGVMLLFLWIDNIFNTLRFYKRHVLALAAFMVAYLLVNAVVTFCHRPVYRPIDWISFMSYAFKAIAIKLSIAHFFLGAVYYDLFKRQRIEKEKENYLLRTDAGKLVAIGRKISDENALASHATPQCAPNTAHDKDVTANAVACSSDGPYRSAVFM